MKKLGIYGGTFSPIHYGHINAAKTFYDALSLDELLIMPTFISPHKEVNELIDPALRLEMAALALEGEDRNIKISDYEISKGGTSYTYLTLQHFSSPDTELYFLMGSDMLLSLDKWRNPDIISSLCTVVLIRRENDEQVADKLEKAKEYLKCKYGTKIIEISCKPIEMASKDIRAAINAGDDISRFVPKAVASLIKDNRLYLSDPLYAQIKKLVPKKRLRHIFGTEDQALELASIFDLDREMTEKVRVAAILHDITKYYTATEHMDYLESLGVELDADTLESEKTMHQLSGAYKARELFSDRVDDTVFNAIRYHTTGRADMTLSEKIIYLSDYIEPTRTFSDCVKLREYFYNGIKSGEDKYSVLLSTLITSFEMTVNDLISQGKKVHRDTTEAMEYLKKEKENVR